MRLVVTAAYIIGFGCFALKVQVMETGNNTETCME